ncbi:DUF4199 domain-containing protein [Chryseobacterium koreense]|uniref:DUF4199 domain-containing protein n=2 Tax=root TaxID=1 RepID=A0A0J7J2L2_9FLAO|nr:DUF4199 domain-containing protein [Chryseobacterium koreense]KMQ72618.1 hypothetical protein ACM44_00525 [Chryseobacterium koreense CCUG 49689]MBB5333009.1 hypothetical protein [Chryseobacterium koreense]
MTKNGYAVGFLLFVATMVVFFLLYFFGMNTQYYHNSVLINAFLLPAIYLVGAFLSINNLRKTGARMGFREIFGRAFVPMFVGGLLSVVSIFYFFNKVDPKAKDLLSYQYIQSYRTSLEEDYSSTIQILKPNSEEWKSVKDKYEEAKMRIANKERKNEEMFSARNFSYIFAGYCVYFLVLSTFFATFFRSRTEH